MSNGMNSHDLAKAMAATAEYLLARPQFETPMSKHSLYLGSYWDGKDAFIGAVKALGNVTKEYRDDELQVTTLTELPIWMRISRSVVCRKVQDERWECEALLGPHEEAVLDAAAEGNVVDRTIAEVGAVVDRAMALGIEPQMEDGRG